MIYGKQFEFTGKCNSFLSPGTKQTVPGVHMKLVSIKRGLTVCEFHIFTITDVYARSVSELGAFDFNLVNASRPGTAGDGSRPTSRCSR